VRFIVGNTSTQTSGTFIYIHPRSVDPKGLAKFRADRFPDVINGDDTTCRQGFRHLDADARSIGAIVTRTGADEDV
jgi:hypothetical protein